MKRQMRRALVATGCLGVLILLVTISISARHYTGRHGEAYRFLNHFISELGERGVSRFADIFNAGLVAAGISYLPFSILMGIAFKRNAWAKVAMVFGVMAGLFLAGVGLFPMNQLKPHFFVATMFFRASLLTILLFSIATFRQPKEDRILPNAATVAGLSSVLCYVAFLFIVPRLPGPRLRDVFGPAASTPRPDWWALAIAEWLIFISTSVWFLAMALFLARNKSRG